MHLVILRQTLSIYFKFPRSDFCQLLCQAIFDFQNFKLTRYQELYAVNHLSIHFAGSRASSAVSFVCECTCHLSSTSFEICCSVLEMLFHFSFILICIMYCGVIGIHFEICCIDVERQVIDKQKEKDWSKNRSLRHSGFDRLHRWAESIFDNALFSIREIWCYPINNVWSIL